jgi:hypothetical protein
MAAIPRTTPHPHRERLTVDALVRWVAFGAHWRIVYLTDRRATVEFCACTGEPMQQLTSTDQAVVQYLRSAEAINPKSR